MDTYIGLDIGTKDIDTKDTKTLCKNKDSFKLLYILLAIIIFVIFVIIIKLFFL